MLPRLLLPLLLLLRRCVAWRQLGRDGQLDDPAADPFVTTMSDSRVSLRVCANR